MKYYDSFTSLPGKKGHGIVIKDRKQDSIEKFRRIDWSTVAFLSTNSAYNIRTSQIIKRFLT